MRTILFNFFLMAAISLLISCGGSNENKAPGTDTTAGSSMMKENNYDPTKIDPAAPVVEITLHTKGNTMTDMSYDQVEIRVKAKSTVKLTLVNGSTDAAMQHNFVLVDDGTVEKVATAGVTAGAAMNFTPKMSSVYVGTKVVLPGKSETITFPAPDKGNYEFVCTYPGHWQKMRGKFIVE